MVVEIVEGYQALDCALALRDRLERASDPLEVPELIAEALRFIVGWDREGAGHLSFRLSDPLEAVLAQVTAAYKAVVIPHDYEQWWAQAQQELKDLIERCTREIETLHALPCATRRQRRKVRERDYYGDFRDNSMSFRATIDDAEAFARWKTELLRSLRDSIDGFRRTEQRLRDNLPAAPPGGASLDTSDHAGD